MKEPANTTAIPTDGLKTKRCPAERSLDGLGVDVQDQDTFTDFVTGSLCVGVAGLGCGDVTRLLDPICVLSILLYMAPKQEQNGCRQIPGMSQ
jgi:hypothetical protein